MVALYYGIWAIILTVLQPTLMRSIEIWSIAPNLFLCFIILAGVLRGRTEGAIVGAVFGLLYDLIIGRMIGVSSLIYLFLGFGAGIIGNQFFGNGKHLVGIISIFTGTLICGLLYYLVRKMGWNDIGFVTAFFRISVIEGIYNSVVGFILAFPMMWLMKLMRIKRMV